MEDADAVFQARHGPDGGLDRYRPVDVLEVDPDLLGLAVLEDDLGRQLRRHLADLAVLLDHAVRGMRGDLVGEAVAGHGRDDGRARDVEIDRAARVAVAPFDRVALGLLDGRLLPGLGELALEVAAGRGSSAEAWCTAASRRRRWPWPRRTARPAPEPAHAEGQQHHGACRRQHQSTRLGCTHRLRDHRSMVSHKPQKPTPADHITMA